MSRYIATKEDTEKDREDFFSHFGQNGGKVSTSPSIDFNRIAHRWRVLLETQNGEDFDDYLVDPGVVKYAEKWCDPPAQVLALGTGTGRELLAARSLGYEAVGTTLGKKNPTFASWRLGIDPKDIFYGDNCTLPHAAASFDAVLGGQVFEHCHAPYLFLFECCRVLKERGLLILEWPPYIRTRNGSLVADDKSQNMMSEYTEDNIHHTCCWTPAQGFIMVNRAGFENVEVFLDDYAEGSDLIKIDESHPAWYSNVAPKDIILKATRRNDNRLPDYVRKALFC